MPHYPQSVPDNIAYLQAQINRQGTAPLGPVSVGPGEGHIRLYTETGDTGRLDPSGISIHYRGSLRGLTPLTESFANSIEGHTRLLETHDDRLDGHDGRLDGHEGRLDGHDSTLASHGSRLGSAESRLDGHDSAISSHNTRINNAQSAANTANSRAGSLESRASTLESNISSHNTRINNAQSAANTAQSRADAAYSLAASKASVSYVDTKASQNELDAMRDQVKHWIEIARRGDPSLPPWGGA